jgi:hypothetical protein
MFEFREIERDAAAALNERLYNLADLIRVFPDQSALALDDRHGKIILILGFFDLEMESSAG